MRRSGFGRGAATGAPRRAGGLAAAVALAAALAGCTSIGDSARNLFSGAGQSQNQSDLPADYFIDIGTCPTIAIRPGTEALTVYATRNADDRTPENVRYQGTIARTARECTRAGETLNIRVGVAGRVAAGPKGAAGSVTVPVRVAVILGHDQVLYSNLHQVTVDLAPPNLLAEYAFVDEAVSVNVPVAQSDGLQIYVGFDEQR